MGAIASQITGLTTVYSTVYSDGDQRKHQSSASLAFVWGIHRGPVNSSHKWPVTRKMFPFDDVIMLTIILYASKRSCNVILMRQAYLRLLGALTNITQHMTGCLLITSLSCIQRWAIVKASALCQLGLDQSFTFSIIEAPWYAPSGTRHPRGSLNMEMPSYKHSYSHYKDKTVSRSSCLYSGNPIPGKMVFKLKQGSDDCWLECEYDATQNHITQSIGHITITMTS